MAKGVDVSFKIFFPSHILTNIIFIFIQSQLLRTNFRSYQPSKKEKKIASKSSIYKMEQGLFTKEKKRRDREEEGVIIKEEGIIIEEEESTEKEEEESTKAS